MCGRTACGLLLFLTLAGAAACRPASTSGGGQSAAGDPAAGRRKPKVYAVNYPLDYFARRIGGDLVDVTFPVPADVDPAFWKPADAAVAEFQQADLILLNGAGYAQWTQLVSLPESRLVDTSASFADKLIRVDDGVVHSHGPGGEHSHQGLAFTTWLDPQLALLQAAAVHKSLVRLLPASAPELDASFQQLKTDLQQLDQQLEVIVARYRGEPLLASHPVYQYLARRCGWKLSSLHWEPDEMPDAGQWQALDKLLETHPSKWMLWEAEPRRETAEKLSARGVAGIVFSPCGNRPETSYLEVMTENIQRLETIFPR